MDEGSEPNGEYAGTILFRVRGIITYPAESAQHTGCIGDPAA
jgi:hypothetical protein